MNREELIKKLADPYWRLNNLYLIVDKRGHRIRFKLNWAQEELYRDVWYCNVILKARQLGISTFISLLFLDRCLFNNNMSAGIIAHTLEDAQHLFKRVKFAYDTLPESIRASITAENDTTNMLKFSNGSSIRVGTSLRSSTFQYLHISEFGKICAKYPDKAQEIITGSLNTVAPGQYVFIESTAEGRSGYFYDICRHAQKAKEEKKQLNQLDFRFHFFPWWQEPSYRIGNTFELSKEMAVYFEHLAGIGIELDDEQKSWYVAKEATQQDDMRREYPSSPEEAWEVTHEGYCYGRQMTLARMEKRIGFVPYEEKLPVHTAWDLGHDDPNGIIYFQLFGKEIRIIDYDEGSNESLAHWIGVMGKKPYAYGKHIAPHDIMVKEYTSGLTRQSTARGFGINFLPALKTELKTGIDAVRTTLIRCFIDSKKCERLIKALDNYKYEWNEKFTCWSSKPLHDWASHGADAMRTLATGLHLVEARMSSSPAHSPNQYIQDRFNAGNRRFG